MRRVPLLLAILVFGCGDDDASVDSGGRDSGAADVDAGSIDSGVIRDGGGGDAGVDSGGGADGSLDSGADAGIVEPDAGRCAVAPPDACAYFDLRDPGTQIDVHGAVRIPFTAAAPAIVSATMIFTVVDAAGVETTVMFDAAPTDTVLRGDAGSVVPISATGWTRLEIAIVDPCATTPPPRAVFVFVSEKDGRIEATCSAP
jgi:hypothetical protein